MGIIQEINQLVKETFLNGMLIVGIVLSSIPFKMPLLQVVSTKNNYKEYNATGLKRSS